MGRGNGKLIPFLVNGLQNNLYLNLNYESSDILNAEFPRYDKKKIVPYEKILIDWYKITGKADKYPGYSTAKSVFQAALKKSIFLIPLDSIGGKLRYRFANKEEIEGKKQALKMKMVKKEAWNDNSMDVSSPQNPPSVASSGYVSGGEECTEMFSDLKPCILDNLLQNQMSYDKHVPDCLLQDQMTYDEHVPDCLLQDQMTYDEHLPDTLFEDEKKINNVSSEFPLDFDALQLWDGDGDYTNYLESLLNKATSDNSSQETVQLNEATSVSSCDGGFQNISLNETTVSNSSDEAAQNIPQDGVVQQSAKSDGNLNNVDEIKLPLVTESQVPKKTYWLATQKQKFGDILMLVHEKKEIEAENQQILEGSACVPEDVWEPGFSYDFKEGFELNERYFCFFICKTV